MAKSKWDDVKDKLILIEGWSRDGLTDEQIWTKLGIGKTAFYKYKKEHADLANSLKKGKEVVDREVENSLLDNAMGYEYTEQQAIKIKEVYYNDQGKRCEKENVKIVEVKKYKPGETTAQIFWLKNRKPEQWRDKQDIDLNGKLTLNKKLEDLI